MMALFLTALSWVLPRLGLSVLLGRVKLVAYGVVIVAVGLSYGLTYAKGYLDARHHYKVADQERREEIARKSAVIVAHDAMQRDADAKALDAANTKIKELNARVAKSPTRGRVCLSDDSARGLRSLWRGR